MSRVIFASKKGGAAAQRKRRFSLHTSRIKRSILFLIFLSVVVVVSPERERERKRKKSANIERSIFSLRERSHTEEEEQSESERRVITRWYLFLSDDDDDRRGKENRVLERETVIGFTRSDLIRRLARLIHDSE